MQIAIRLIGAADEKVLALFDWTALAYDVL